MMKQISLLLLFFLLTLTNSFSQNSFFTMYRFECSELFNIELRKPKGFKVIDGLTPFRVNEKESVGMFYCMTLQSKDKNCLVLFPYFLQEPMHPNASENMTFGELKAGLNLNINDNTLELDTAKYIEKHVSGNVDNYFNADTVFICQIPLIEPYRKVYNHCIAINIVKVKHPSAMMKVFFSEEGKRKEEEYMQAIFKSILYSDVVPEIDKQKCKEVYKKFKCRFFLYKRKNFSMYLHNNN